MPIQRLPSRALIKALTPVIGTPVESGVVDAVKRPPSKRTRPTSVPSHRYPSLSCSIARMRPAGSPSLSFQVVTV